MDSGVKKSFNYNMRCLHRDIGFFLIGITIIYSISGIVLIYRDTDLLKQDVVIERELAPNLEASELGGILHKRDFKVLKSEGDIVYFQDGTYNRATGVVKYKSKELPSFLNKFNSLHKSSSRNIVHWFTTIYGILLLFLAISSFWMFNAKSKPFRRGIFIAGAGIVVSLILLLI